MITTHLFAFGFFDSLAGLGLKPRALSFLSVTALRTVSRS